MSSKSRRSRFSIASGSWNGAHLTTCIGTSFRRSPFIVEGPVLYDLGDFLDDYAVDPLLRNDLGLLFLVAFDEDGPVRLEALPLRLEYCHTRLADGDDARWVAERFRSACARFGTRVGEADGRLVVDWRAGR